MMTERTWKVYGTHTYTYLEFQLIYYQLMWFFMGLNYVNKLKWNPTLANLWPVRFRKIGWKYWKSSKQYSDSKKEQLSYHWQILKYIIWSFLLEQNHETIAFIYFSKSGFIYIRHLRLDREFGGKTEKVTKVDV